MLRSSLACCAAALLLAASPFAQNLPDGWQTTVIGSPVELNEYEWFPGTAPRLYIRADGEFGGSADALLFAYKPIPGPVATIRSQVANASCSFTPCGDRRGAGLMLRASTSADAPFVAVLGSRDEGISTVVARRVPGGESETITTLAQTLRYDITRSGTTVRVWESGVLLSQVEVDLGAETLAGIFAADGSAVVQRPVAEAADVHAVPGLTADWLQSSRPNSGEASGSLDGERASVYLVAPAGATSIPERAGYVSVYRRPDLTATDDVVEGRLVSSIEVDVPGEPGGTGLVLFNRPGTGEYVALLVRPDGEVVLRRRLRPSATAPVEVTPDVLVPRDPGSDVWRLYRTDRSVRAVQRVGDAWVPRAEVLGSVRGIGGAIAINADGPVGDVRSESSGRRGIPAPWIERTIGGAQISGGTVFESALSTDGEAWTVGGGGDISGVSDRYHGVFQSNPGSKTVELSGRIQSVTGDSPWAKGGLMIRALASGGTDAGAPYVLAYRRPNGEYHLQSRNQFGGTTTSQPLSLPSTADAELTLRYDPSLGRADLRSGDAMLWSAPIELGASAAPTLVSTSTDLDDVVDVAVSVFTDVRVDFSTPDPAACGAVPSSVGTVVSVRTGDAGGTDGTACWDAAAGQLLVRGSGDIWGDLDAFQYVYQPAGAFDLAADLTTAETPPNSWTKSGLMVRSTLDPGSPFVFLLSRPNGLGVYVQMRMTMGGEVESFQLADRGAQRLRLWSDGATVRAEALLDDGTPTEFFSTSFAASDQTTAGFAVTATTGQFTRILTEAAFADIAFTTDGTPATVWTSDYVLAESDPLQTGSATPLGTVGGLDRFEVVSAGDIWGFDDQFQFVHTVLDGDGVLGVQISAFEAVAPWAEPWAKAGPMIRQIVDGSSVHPQAAHASVFTTLDRGIHFFQREAAGEETFLFNTAVDGSTPAGGVRLRIERVGDELFSSFQLEGEDGLTVFDESVFAGATGPAAVGFALTSTQPDFQSPGQVRAEVGLRLTQTTGATAQPWTESFDGMPRATADGGETAWWGGEFAALTGDGALAIGGTTEAATWRTEPLSATRGLDARLTVDTDGAGAGDRLHVLALIGDAEVEIAMLSGESGTQTIEADGLRGSSVELRLVAEAPGGTFRVTEATLSPALPPVADEPEAEAPVAALALSAPAPNPTRGDAWIELAARDAGIHRLEVVDLLGRRVATVQADARSGERVRVSLPTAGLGAGVYVVRATAPDGAQAAQRLTVVR